MRVDELQAALELMDPKAPVYVWGDGELFDLTVVEQIDPEQARIEGKHKHSVALG